MVDDNLLVEGLILGDRDAEVEFYNTYSKVIKNNIIYKYGHIEYIDDDVSDIMIKVLLNIENYDSTISNLNTWIGSITKNHMIDKWRTSSPKKIYDLNYGEDSPDYEDNQLSFAYTTTNTNEYDTINALNHISKQVSVSDYNLLTMKYLWGYKYDEIADEVGTTSNTVSNRVNYIKTKLKNSNLELCYDD